MNSLRECPLCNSESQQVKRHVEHEGDVFVICECSWCKCLFVGNANNDPTKDSDQESVGYETIPSPKTRHYQIRSLLDSELGSEGDVIEIGAGYGELGKLLSETGYDYTGFEPMPTRASVANKGDIHVRQDIFTSQSIDEPADAVIIDNVLEHVMDPVGIVKDAVDSLRMGGLLVVIVPNRYDIRRGIPSWREKHFWIPKWHINFFRAIDLKRLFHKMGVSFQPFGFDSVEIRRRSDAMLLPKTLLDKARLYPFGLYCYGKRRNKRL